MAYLKLSYFEFYDLHLDIFVSTKPTNKTTFDKETMPKDGQEVFSSIPDESYFRQHALALKENNLGFYATFWFLPQKKEYNVSEIREWMRSLHYHTSTITEHYGECIITSSMDPQFRMRVFVKSESLPQESTDILPVYVSPTGEVSVPLREKPRSDTVIIHFDSGDSLEVLSEPLFGKTVMVSLEEDDKTAMQRLRNSFVCAPIKMAPEQISKKMRLTLEANGYDDIQDCYYVHCDNRAERDVRYSIYPIVKQPRNELFGYMRDSYGDTIVMLLNKKPEGFVPINEAISALIGPLKRYETAAYWAECIQLIIASNSAIISSPAHQRLEKQYNGLTVQEARAQLQGTLRVGCFEGRSIKIDRIHTTNMNISLNTKAKIDRILGFY